MTPGNRNFTEPEFGVTAAADHPPKTVRPWNFGWIHALSTIAILVLGLFLVKPFPEPAIEAPAPGVPAGSGPGQVETADLEPNQSANTPADPEAWLERILELKAEGRHEAFSSELAAFRQAWPEYPLPDGLTD